MALKVWCVSYYNSLGCHYYSKLFLTEREAKVFAEKRISGGSKDVKCCQVSDIWNYTAQRFTDKIIDIVANRLDKDSNCIHLYGLDNFNEDLDEELRCTAAEAGIEDFSCDLWNIFESPGLDIYALSYAWTYKGELKHYTDTLEVF